jgi:hypothetical protein
MIKELARLKKMQRRRVQVVLIHHAMRRVVHQARELPIPIKLENRATTTPTKRRRRHRHRRVDHNATRRRCDHHLVLPKTASSDRGRWHWHVATASPWHRRRHVHVSRGRTVRHRHLHHLARRGHRPRPGRPGRTEVCATDEGRRAGWPLARHGHRYVGARRDHGPLQRRGRWFRVGHRHWGALRDDWWDGPRRRKASAVQWWLRGCILRLRHAHSRGHEWLRHRVGGHSQRRCGVLIALSEIEEPTALSAGSDVAVRGRLKLGLGLLRHWVARST